MTRRHTQTFKLSNSNPDPVRRLLASIVKQAILDLSDKSCPKRDKQSAIEFIRSHIDDVAYFSGSTPQNIRGVLGI